MRVLVADHNATLLAAIAETFAGHLDIATATGRDAAVELLRQQKIDVVVACDTLLDYTGLELLSEIAEYSPAALLVFAASPARLKRLESRLGFFGLFGTLTYPIDARKLLPALALARRRLEVETAASGPRHVVLEDKSPDEPHVTAPGLGLGQPAPIGEKTAEQPIPAPRTPSRRSASQRIAPSQPAASEAASRQPKAAATTTDRGGQASNAQAAKSQKRPPARTPTVITAAQRAAFQRALAKRNAEKAEGRAGDRGRSSSASRARSPVAGRGEQPSIRTAAAMDATRRTPPQGSLSELARMATSGRLSPLPSQGPSKRAALFIGGGVLAALAVAALNFQHSGARDAVERSRTASVTAPATFSPQAPSPFAEPEGSRNSLAIQGPQQPAPSEESTATSASEPAPVNPDSAPPDPPPPPALERPGPMEPPSSLLPPYSESSESQ